MRTSARNLELLRDAVTEFLGDMPAKVVLFGSRARGEHRPASDVDIGIVPRGKIDRRRLALLREKIDDLNIPYKVEIVDLSEASADLREQALKDCVVWKD